MTWVKISDDFAEHPKIVAAGPLAMAMQVAALCYCSRYLTDGFIPEPAARTLIDWHVDVTDTMPEGHKILSEIAVTNSHESRAVDADLVIDMLVREGIWERADGGYMIHDYLDYNPSKSEVLAERQKIRNRVAKHRSRNVNVVTPLHDRYKHIGNGAPASQQSNNMVPPPGIVENLQQTSSVGNLSPEPGGGDVTPLHPRYKRISNGVPVPGPVPGNNNPPLSAYADISPQTGGEATKINPAFPEEEGLTTGNDRHTVQGMTEEARLLLSWPAWEKFVGFQETETLLVELRESHPGLNLREEIAVFREWWSEGRKQLKRPKTALRNWIRKAAGRMENNTGEKTHFTDVRDAAFWEKYAARLEADAAAREADLPAAEQAGEPM